MTIQYQEDALQNLVEILEDYIRYLRNAAASQEKPGLEGFYISMNRTSPPLL